jgi:hypothetical protein
MNKLFTIMNCARGGVKPGAAAISRAWSFQVRCQRTPPKREFGWACRRRFRTPCEKNGGALPCKLAWRGADHVNDLSRLLASVHSNRTYPGRECPLCDSGITVRRDARVHDRTRSCQCQKMRGATYAPRRAIIQNQRVCTSLHAASTSLQDAAANTATRNAP